MASSYLLMISLFTARLEGIRTVRHQADDKREWVTCSSTLGLTACYGKHSSNHLGFICHVLYVIQRTKEHKWHGRPHWEGEVHRKVMPECAESPVRCTCMYVGHLILSQAAHWNNNPYHCTSGYETWEGLQARLSHCGRPTRKSKVMS